MQEDMLTVLRGEPVEIDRCFGNLPEEVKEHSRRVAEQSFTLLQLAFDNGIFDDDGEYFPVEYARRAALYHDIGQTLIPEKILKKKQEWTGPERRVYEKHTILGGKLIEQYRGQHPLRDGEDWLWNIAAEMALCHHERWDGKGYPYGTMTNAIPISARAVAIADVYDSLLYGTPSRMPLPQEYALLDLVVGSGKRFDPRLIELFKSNHPLIT